MTIKICKRCKNKREIVAKGLCNSCYPAVHFGKKHLNDQHKIWRKKNKTLYRKIVAFSLLKGLIKNKKFTKEELQKEFEGIIKNDT